MQPALDLNKRINLFKVGQPSINTDCKENNNPQYSVKSNNVVQRLPRTSKQQVLLSRSKVKASVNKKSERDSNYNIHRNKSNTSTDIEQNVPKAMSMAEINALYSCTNKGKQSVETDSGNKGAKNEKKKFETVLCSLDNQLNQMKEVSQTQILKRLSGHYQHEPKNFTDKLLTVIEESMTVKDDDTCNTSAINLSRLTTEFRKMCKFIEDESAPEWPVSPMAVPSFCQSPTCNKSIKASTNENINSPVVTSTTTTPISGTEILRKRFFNKISKKNCNGSIDKTINESGNASFECLEAQCQRLFPKEKEDSKPLQRSVSSPSLLSMSQIQHICEKQMASLNLSDIDETEERNAVLSPQLRILYSSDTRLYQNLSNNKSQLNCEKLKALHNNSKSIQYDNVSYSQKKSKKIFEKTEFNTINPDQFINGYTSLNPDELEKTLLQDIAEKRKRCLDTARLITEINSDPEAMEAHKTLKMSPLFTDDNELNSLTNNETKFLRTLMTCKDYQSYLEKQKPLFQLLHDSNPCTPETSYKEIDRERIKSVEKEVLSLKRTPNARYPILSPNVKSCNLYKSPLLKKQDEKKKERAESTKSKLFTTPGKTPPSSNCRKKKEYFPNICGAAKSSTEKHILKSPHAEGLYRLNYNTIISPVGMYIRGTDMQLLKNVRAKTTRLHVTPGKDNDKTSPNRNSKQNTPSKCVIRTQEKVSIKLNLSPKVDINMLEKDNTPKSHFVLPKVSYNLPLQVKTVCNEYTFLHFANLTVCYIFR